jgi:membrane-associated phospholipid phosphatase
MARKHVIITALAGAALAVGAGLPALAASSHSAHRAGDPGAFAAGSGKLVVDWNKTLVTILGTPGAQPATIHPTRSLAILQAAEYDAVVSVTHVGRPYLFTVPVAGDASAAAAADQAAHDVLAALYPGQASTIDAQLATELAGVPSGAAQTNGIAAGKAVAAKLLGIRATDGSAVTPPPFVPGTAPGDYMKTPPLFPAPVFTNWGNITPFVMDTGAQFRPVAPPPVTSARYARSLAIVQSLGEDTSTTRTPEQTVIGKFWGAAPIWVIWNEVAQDQVTGHNSSLQAAATDFATLDLALGDTGIGLYDAKYHFLVWRPVTAIEEGATTGNPRIVPNPTWAPLTNTAADPSYPGAHSGFSFAAATVLTELFGNSSPVTIHPDALPGQTRSFPNFLAAALEAAQSRIFAGQHTTLDDFAGRRLGRSIGRLVLHRLHPDTDAG